MAKCRSCGAEIVFIRTAAGKAMPCDVELKPYVKVMPGLGSIVLESGEVVNGLEVGSPGIEPDGYGYVSHFASCPGADRHRGKYK